MISQKKVRLMALSALYERHHKADDAFPRRLIKNCTKEQYCLLKSVQSAGLTCLALILIQMLRLLVTGSWEEVLTRVEENGFFAFFDGMSFVFAMVLIALYAAFAYWWYGRRYEEELEEAKREQIRLDLISRLDETRRMG